MHRLELDGFGPATAGDAAHVWVEGDTPAGGIARVVAYAPEPEARAAGWDPDQEAAFRDAVRAAAEAFVDGLSPRPRHAWLRFDPDRVGLAEPVPIGGA